MQTSKLEFQSQQAFIIINKAQDMALKTKETDPSNGMPFNPQDDHQLFFIQKIDPQKEVYEIINLQANKVMTQQNRQIRLSFGKQKASQLFTIVKSPFHGFFTYYWIKNAEQNNKCLYFDKILRIGPFHSAAQDQMFRFQAATSNNTLKETFFLINQLSNKVLDVPRGTTERGERIILYDLNKRFNQRWRWIPSGNAYLIQNLLSKLFLDIEGESRKVGASVIQWDKHGSSNQLWLPQPVGNGTFKIRSVHEPSLFLSIKNDSLDNCSKLQVNHESALSVLWMIDGALP